MVLEPTRKAKTSVADVTRMEAPADASALPIRVAGSSVGSMWSYWFMMTNMSSAPMPRASGKTFISGLKKSPM